MLGFYGQTPTSIHDFFPWQSALFFMLSMRIKTKECLVNLSLQRSKDYKHVVVDSLILPYIYTYEFLFSKQLKLFIYIHTNVDHVVLILKFFSLFFLFSKKKRCWCIRFIKRYSPLTTCRLERWKRAKI